VSSFFPGHAVYPPAANFVVSKILWELAEGKISYCNNKKAYFLTHHVEGSGDRQSAKIIGKKQTDQW